MHADQSYHESITSQYVEALSRCQGKKVCTNLSETVNVPHDRIYRGFRTTISNGDHSSREPETISCKELDENKNLSGKSCGLKKAVFKSKILSNFSTKKSERILMNTCSYETCIPKAFQMNVKQVSHFLRFLPVKSEKSRGRPSADPVRMLQGIFYLLRTGCQWNALPLCFGPSSTIHDHFKKLITNNVFVQAWSDMLEQYDWKVGLALREQVFDCCHKKAPLGGQATGCSPVDRKKLGTKQGIVVDRNGIPLAVSIAAGNQHDSRMCIPTISAMSWHREPPFKTMELDAAFDAKSIREALARMGYSCRVSKNRRRKRTREVQPKHQFRWVVERTHSWLNRFRRLLIRWEKQVSNCLGLLQFACCIIISRKI